MKEDLNHRPLPNIDILRDASKAGSTGVFPTQLEHIALKLFRLGYGYPAIIGILYKEDRLNPDFSSVKRTLKRLNILPYQHSSVKLKADQLI
jgi:hypothetical protein